MINNTDKDKELKPLELIEIIEDKGAKTFIYRDPEKKETLIDKLRRK